MPLLVELTGSLGECGVRGVRLAEFSTVQLAVVLLTTLCSGQLTVALIGLAPLLNLLGVLLAYLEVRLDLADVVIAVLRLELSLVLGAALGIPLLTALPSTPAHSLDPVVRECVTHGVSFWMLMRQAYSWSCFSIAVTTNELAGGSKTSLTCRYRYVLTASRFFVMSARY